MYKLTEEQINYIIEEYGGSKQLINTIERKLNLLGVIEFEDDYYELVIAIVSQKETDKLKLEGCTTREEKINTFINLDTIIEMELNRKYNYFEDSKESIRRKMGL